MAVAGDAPSFEHLAAALSSDESTLHAAAAFCYAERCSDDQAIQRRLLLGPAAHEPSEISDNGRYQLIVQAGLSCKEAFIPVLTEALLGHYHYCHSATVAEALELLGAELPEDGPHVSSISVNRAMGSNAILISRDERFTGSSNCRHCRFFPCRINAYHAGGIEDCSLSDRHDPDALGEIRDLRFEGHSQPQEASTEQKTAAMEQAIATLRALGSQVSEGKYPEVLKGACAQILAGEPRSRALAWHLLARVLLRYGEDRLAFITHREALNSAADLPPQCAKEREEIENLRPRAASTAGYRTLGYRKNGFHVAALDAYVNANLLEEGRSGGTWFEMGECHRELGELHLAEVFYRRAAAIATETALVERFTAAADAVRIQRAEARDPGVDTAKRREERQLTDPTLRFTDQGERLRRHRAEDPRQELAFWWSLREGAEPGELAVALLGRLRLESEHFLLDVDPAVHSPLFRCLKRFSEEAYEEAAHQPALRNEAAPFEFIYWGLEHAGRYAAAAALFALHHDLSCAKEAEADGEEGGNAIPYRALLRLKLGENLQLWQNRLRPDDEALQRFGLGTLELLRTIEPVDGPGIDDVQELREAAREWLNGFSCHGE